MNLKKLLAKNIWIWSALGSLVLWIVISVMMKNFSLNMLLVNATLASFLVLLSLGQMTVITSGNGAIDLSSQYTVALAAYVSSLLITSYGVLIGLCVTLCICAFIGVCIGVINLYFKVPPMITTLAVGFIVYSAVLIISTMTTGMPSKEVAYFTQSLRVFRISPMIFIAAVIAVVMGILMYKTQFGKRLHAVGQNRTAAALAGINVERTVIAGVVLAQLIKPGNRVWVGNFVNAANMRNASIAFGSIASSLTQVVFNQIWRRYGIPVWSATPAYSSAKKIDFQCGYEKGIAAILAAVSGSHAIHMHGGLHGELTYHPVQSILDDDIAGMVGHFLNGVEVTEDTLLIDLINKVGPIPGHYFEEEHTIKSWRAIEYIPRVADRLAYEKWISKGKKGALELAKERMQKILNTHTPIPLSRDQDQEIEEILNEARSYYNEKGLM